jgi:hypothetical protein
LEENLEGFLKQRKKEGKGSRNVSRTFDEIILDLKASKVLESLQFCFKNVLKVP